MAERWRRPAKVLDVRPAHQGLWLPDGRVMAESIIELDAETVDRMRTGYMCAKCQEPFEHPWPVRCHVCGAPIRDDQAEFFAREFGGVEPASTRLSVDEEIEYMHELLAKEKENGSVNPDGPVAP